MTALNVTGLSAQPAAPGANALVDLTTKKQLHNDQTTARFRYYARRLEHKNFHTYELIESDAGVVQWLIAEDDRLLNDIEQRGELAWLDRVSTNPEIMRRAKDKDGEEAQRRARLIRALPQAFIYERDGEEDDGRIIRLRFRANPEFKATSRETQICRAPEGRFWIDADAQMFVKAEGRLICDVSFGWGFLGSLNRGGNVLVEQHEVAPGVWKITRIQARLDDKKLLFKSIRIRIDEQISGFQAVPEKLSISDAVELLRSSKRTLVPPD